MKSSKLNELHKIYGKRNSGDLSPNEQHLLKSGLESIENITTSAQAKKFLSLLALVREAETRSIDGLGPDAMATITGAFAGGDEGVYAADTDLMNARFIFELVQNVDDCKYKNVEDCKLRINFDIDEDRLILTYNELGFKPENVMAITGLGNSTKNHKKARSSKDESKLDQGDLQEIGEKGIGFKSIFGLAKTVNIKSQYFNFTINRNSFFIPVVGDYSDFKHTNNTILELHLDTGMVKELYHFLKKKYDKVEAIVNENPILFLNKMTEIEYFVSENDFFGFRVGRLEENSDYSETDTIIEYYSSNSKKNRSIEAIRFSHQIEYSIEECKSRYGEAEDKTRKHKIIVIAPKNAALIKEGRIYSFFATSETINAPFIVHAPFRLNSGRTKIDSQAQGVISDNKWFIRTKNETSEMLKYVYERLAQIQKENIRYFIPKDSLFNEGCALSCTGLNRNIITKWHLFEGVDGKYYPYSKVCLLDYKADIKDLIQIHQILDISKVLLNVSYRLNKKFAELNIELFDNIYDRLLKIAVNHPSYTSECCKYLIDYEPGFKLAKVGINSVKLQFEQVIQLTNFKKITQWINKHTLEYLVSPILGTQVEIFISKRGKDISNVLAFCETYKESINPKFVRYINRVTYIEYDIPESIYTYNCIIGKNALEDFAKLYRVFDPNDKYFYPFLQVESVSESIDTLCEQGESISDYEFLKRLKDYRKFQKHHMGKQYSSILDLIEKAGTNIERFFSEILQNIDDCIYPEKPHAVIRFGKIKDEYKLYCEYNEIGFSREQIRAITAIGDSTKKKLLSATTTGEKGVGFKSIFSVCEKVTIASGTTKFTLTDKEPTIPIELKEISAAKGTRMVFTIKSFFSNYVQQLLDNDEKMISYCLCLKQLHSLVINQKDLIVSDTDTRRRIKYNQKIYEYYKYEYEFKVTSQLALYQRRKAKDVLQIQKITYLAPLENNYNIPYYVYSTFPTQEKIKIPIIIDMPLHLDTARERMLENDWNKEILKHLELSLPELYYKMLPLYATDIVQFMPEEGRVLNNRHGHFSNLLSILAKMKLFKKPFEKEYISLEEGYFSHDIEYIMCLNYKHFLPDDYSNNLLEKNDIYYERLEHIFGGYIKQRDYHVICEYINHLLRTSLRKDVEIMSDEKFRNNLYDFLTNSFENKSIIKNWEIIPVIHNKKTKYSVYSKEIYAPGKDNINSEKYKILDTKIMNIDVFNSIYSRIDTTYSPIKPFSKTVVLDEFYDEIDNVLSIIDLRKRAQKILHLYNSETDLFVEIIKTRKDFPKEKIWLLSKRGEIIAYNNCFICRDNSSQGCLDQVIVAETYYKLAKELEVLPVSEINSFKQLPFQIQLKELRELKNNKNLNHKKELFNSIYLSDQLGSELQDRKGFLELYSIVDITVRNDVKQPKRKITITNDELKKFHKEISEISFKNPQIVFKKEFEIEEFEKDAVLREIETELQLRKQTDKINIMIRLLSNCYYCDTGKREPCTVHTEKKDYLIFDYKVNAEYDIIEVLKAFFLKHFNTEIAINRNIRLYTRDGYENIAKLKSEYEDVESVKERLDKILLNNMEDMKDFLCRPLLVKGVTYGGYAKTCPLCGARVNTELTGMRIYKTKYNGKIIPIISCCNCHENLRYASDIKIDIEKLNEGIFSMQCMINDYEWIVDDVIIRLGHRALIEKMNEEKNK